jgi:formyl-CoA transferase
MAFYDAERSSGRRACLEGVRVLELGSTIAGPSATRHLADLGADVLKVEPPSGDQLRSWGSLAPDGTSWWFKSHNRNKRFLVFDVRRPADAQVVGEIAMMCDVVVENFRPGWLVPFGLDAASLRARKPGLIYVSISGYGQDGPMAARPGYGSVAEAIGGFRHITGESGRPPMRLGISIADELAGLNVALAAVAALRAREIDGFGETIDVSLIESTFSLMEGTLPEFVHAGKVAERSGNRLVTAAPSNVYPTADEGWIVIAGNSQAIFRRLTLAMGAPELATDERFSTNQDRVAHAALLDERISNWTRTLPLAELDRQLAEAEVPAGPILSIDQIAEHPQFQARGAIQTLHDDDGTEVVTYGPAAHFADRKIKLGRPGGTIGRDQEQVLEELGLLTTSEQRTG